MKLLLDENLPRRLRPALHGHDAFTVPYLGWAGVANGELLARAAAAGFDALITNDRGLEYEQHLATLPVAVVVLLVKGNTMARIQPIVPTLLAALDQLQPRQFLKISPP